MRGLILCALCFLLLVIVSAVGLKMRRWKREYRWLLLVFAGSASLYTLLHFLMPPDLGFLGHSLLEPSTPVDFWNGLLIMAMLFHGYWVYVYASGFGPSSNILVAIHERGPQTYDEIADLHRGSGPLDALLARRLPKLQESGYIRKEGEGYVMQPPARKYALLVLLLNRLFNM